MMARLMQCYSCYRLLKSLKYPQEYTRVAEGRIDYRIRYRSQNSIWMAENEIDGAISVSHKRRRTYAAIFTHWPPANNRKMTLAPSHYAVAKYMHVQPFSVFHGWMTDFDRMGPQVNTISVSVQFMFVLTLDVQTCGYYFGLLTFGSVELWPSSSLGQVDRFSYWLA